jgi:hypothetical protein
MVKNDDPQCSEPIVEAAQAAKAGGQQSFFV